MDGAERMAGIPIWPAVDADGEARFADQPHELQQGRLIRQVDAVFRNLAAQFRFADDHHARRRAGAAEFFDGAVAHRFATAAREWMEQNEWRVFRSGPLSTLMVKRALRINHTSCSRVV